MPLAKGYAAPAAKAALAPFTFQRREPNDDERLAAEEFLHEHPLREFALAMFNLNGFLYVE